MSIAEMFIELLRSIRVIVNSEARDGLRHLAETLIDSNAVSVTKDLFNPNRKHLAFIDGSILTKHKDNYSISKGNNND